MQAIEFIKSQFGRGKHSTIEAAKRIDKHQTFISDFISKNRIPRVDSFSLILRSIGFDLIARNRETGEETIIDPPPTIDELVKKLE